MNDKFSLRQFKRKYGTHELCLEAIKQLRFPEDTICPKCKNKTVFYHVSGRSSYACKLCGWHVYPLVGTIFDHSSTPLDLWFFAMYLMVQTRAGISAKQLERMLGVTYKTAWRMFKQIRLLMAQGGSMLDGIVEIDETYIGGIGKNRRYEWNGNEKEKMAVMGMVERGGKAYTKHIPNTGKWTLLAQIKENVSPLARVITDEWGGYIHLPKYGYRHDFVRHAETYVVGDIYTQNVENLWSQIKRGITGVYRVVSKKYLQAYIDEYTWRYNNRLSNGRMFDILLREVTEVKLLSQPALTR
jgi:transposase